MHTGSPLSRFFSHDKGAFVLLWLAGLYLRMAVLAAPPLTPIIGGAMDLGQAAMGALTTLPTLLLAAFAIPGAFITARLGARREVHRMPIESHRDTCKSDSGVVDLEHISAWFFGRREPAQTQH